jgi:hypothetical protein
MGTGADGACFARAGALARPSDYCGYRDYFEYCEYVIV